MITTTPDGSGIRDYINVVDLSKAHVKAIARLIENKGTRLSRSSIWAPERDYLFLRLSGLSKKPPDRASNLKYIRADRVTSPKFMPMSLLPTGNWGGGRVCLSGIRCCQPGIGKNIMGGR